MDEQGATVNVASLLVRCARPSIAGRLISASCKEGEVCVSGPNVMQGYNKLPEASAEVFFDVDGKRYLRVNTKIAHDRDSHTQAAYDTPAYLDVICAAFYGDSGVMSAPAYISRGADLVGQDLWWRSETFTSIAFLPKRKEGTGRCQPIETARSHSLTSPSVP